MISITAVDQSRLKVIPDVKDLGFGQHFSDHWFHAKFNEGRGWNDGAVEPYGAIALDPAASVFHYGQALFEGMKAFRQDDGRIVLFRPEFNFERMCHGAARLCLTPPTREVFFAGLREVLKLDQQWVPRAEGCSLYIRPTLIGTEGFLGVRPSREVVFYILLSPASGYYAGGGGAVRIWVEDQALRAAPGGLGATKAGANYAASLQAGQLAKERGYAQVLWLDVEREGIEEVGTMNVFFVFGDKSNPEVVTPALNGSILAGGVRDSAIQLLKRQGYAVAERRVTMTEVSERHRRGELREAFGTGTAAVISPIGELNFRGQPLVINEGNIGPVASELLSEIVGLQRGRRPDTFGWIKPLAEL